MERVKDLENSISQWTRDILDMVDEKDYEFDQASEKKEQLLAIKNIKTIDVEVHNIPLPE